MRDGWSTLLLTVYGCHVSLAKNGKALSQGTRSLVSNNNFWFLNRRTSLIDRTTSFCVPLALALLTTELVVAVEGSIGVTAAFLASARFAFPGLATTTHNMVFGEWATLRVVCRIGGSQHARGKEYQERVDIFVTSTAFIDFRVVSSETKLVSNDS